MEKRKKAMPRALMALVIVGIIAMVLSRIAATMRQRVMTAISDAMNISSEELEAELHSGKKMREVAASHDVSMEDIQKALKAAFGRK